MARATRSRAKSNSISLDLSKVEGRVNFTEGDHLLEVVEVTQEEGSKAPYLNWKIKAAEGGECEGAMLWNNTSLSEQSLWNLRTFLEALGVEIPDDAFDLDFDEMVGLQFMGSVELEKYEGKKKPVLTDFWEAEEAEAKEEPAPKRRRGAAAKEEPEEEKPARRSRGKAAPAKKEEADLTEEDINDMSEDELGDVIEEHDLDVDLSDFKTLRKQRAAVIDAAQEAGVLGEGDEPDEPEEEPEEKPATRRSRRAAAKEEEPEEEEAPARTRRRRAR